jgi:hypothetical protein
MSSLPGPTMVREPLQNVIVVDFNIPFWSLVGLMIKVSLAAIPAMIVLTIIYAIVGSFLIGMLGGLGRHF